MKRIGAIYFLSFCLGIGIPLGDYSSELVFVGIILAILYFLMFWEVFLNAKRWAHSPSKTKYVLAVIVPLFAAGSIRCTHALYSSSSTQWFVICLIASIAAVIIGPQVVIQGGFKVHLKRRDNVQSEDAKMALIEHLRPYLDWSYEKLSSLVGNNKVETIKDCNGTPYTLEIYVSPTSETDDTLIVEGILTSPSNIPLMPDSISSRFSVSYENEITNISPELLTSGDQTSSMQSP